MTTESLPQEAGPTEPRSRWRAWLPRLLLLLVLGVAAYLRFAGLNWDAGTHLHPDERFLTIVESSVQPVESLAAYFDTANSTLNPNNVGHSFYVYGTLPLFIVRYLAEWLGSTGYDQVHLVGRAAAAAFDLVSVLLVYLLGTRLYRRRVGLLAAAFSAVSVLLIQHAHFFVVDPFANTFVLAALYLSVVVLDEGGWHNYALFGLFTGMAMASKVSTAPVAGAVVLAAGARVLRSEDREKLQPALLGVALAAMASFVAFRLFQPYAFQGTSFFDIRLNPHWLATLSEVRHQASGAVDFPPALQWADRTPIWFSLKNLVLWGLGLPLGLAAWGGWGLAAWRAIQGRGWQRHLIPVVWTGAHFVWRSAGFTQAMRYQLPIYPTLAVLAAWGLWALYDRASAAESYRRPAQVGALSLAGVVLLLTTAYAFGFQKIYTTPMSRVQASRWIFSHVSAAVNVVVETDEGEKLEPLAVPQEFVLHADQPTTLSFRANHEGRATSILTPFVRQLVESEGSEELQFSLYEGSVDGPPVAEARFAGDIPSTGDTRLELELSPAVELVGGASYSLQMHLRGPPAVELRGRPALVIETEQGDQLAEIELPSEQFALAGGAQQLLAFDAKIAGQVRGVRFPQLTALPGAGEDPRLKVSLRRAGESEELASTSSQLDAAAFERPLEIRFESTTALVADQRYELVFELSPGAALTMDGSVIVHETSWDDPMPARIDGYDIGGRYPSRNLELYWADDEDGDGDGVPDKQERIVDSLSDGDYLFISSNRQYGTIARVPSRYPLTTTFYRELFSCPPPEDVWRCADRAEPGQVRNDFGYELIRVFESNPRLFGVEISDQGAEESFTVYDHPQVLVFAKGEDFNADALRRALAQVDVSDVQNVPPNELETRVAQDLIITPARWQKLREHGTWARLFPPEGLLNRFQPAAVVVWWLTISLLGWAVFPLTRRAFPGMKDGGYALARVIGLLLFAWAAWMLGSAGAPVTRLTLVLLALALAALGAIVAWRDREPLRELIREHKREIIWVEVLALSFFAVDLLIRLGNPDLWHPSKGGEKPMDLSYLTAVLKSRTFPPFDPWFAGGYINYYYFGFLFIGLPMKLLGIDPAIGYNLALPTLFALLAVGGYAVGHQLAAGLGEPRSPWTARLGGLLSALMLVLLGNLGTLRMLFNAFQSVAGAAAAGAQNLFVDIGQALIGFAAVLSGADLPLGLDSWYWNPSRAITPGQGEPGPITEFPFFTFLYGDLHAHMIALPLTVAVLAWGVSWLRAAARRRSLGWLEYGWALFLAALLAGALRPTNTWDFPVFLVLAVLAAGTAAWLRAGALTPRSTLEGLIAAGFVGGLALLLFQPYTQSYVQGYTAAEIWQGSKTGLSDYLVVHGLFLFILVSWFLWETREWMAATPLDALTRLRPYLGYLLVGLLAAVVATIAAALQGYPTVLIVVPLLLWAGALFLRPDQTLVKRIAIFLAATAAALTLVVEVVVLRGDIGRMNTVFKFYLQVWTLFSVVGGAAVAWILADLHRWAVGWRELWRGGLALLLFAAGLYPVTAAPAKVQDRMAPAAPVTLDGTAFMRAAERHEMGQTFELNEDYQAIHWLQRNVQGSPVIVEANIPEYRWGSRYTIYTGLPGVLGWNWHQRQQRVAGGAELVSERANEISAFYTIMNAGQARQFLDEYQVEYVMVGKLERAYYETVAPCWPAGEAGESVMCDMAGRPLGMTSPDVTPGACTALDPASDENTLRCPTGGFDKFGQMQEQGVLRLAFESGETRIYEVVR